MVKAWPWSNENMETSKQGNELKHGHDVTERKKQMNKRTHEPENERKHGHNVTETKKEKNKGPNKRGAK